MQKRIATGRTASLTEGVSEQEGAGQPVKEWLETWVRKLSPDDTAIWDFMYTKRGDDAYHEGVELEAQSVLVPVRPSERMLYYTTGDDVRRSAQKHYFHLSGRSYEVSRVCQQYLTLLERRLKECLAACFN